MLAKRPLYMTPLEYRRTIKRLGLTSSGIAKLLHVNPRTPRRWASGESAINARTAMLLRDMAERKITPAGLTDNPSRVM